jgi:uncharacterized membrane protein
MGFHVIQSRPSPTECTQYAVGWFDVHIGDRNSLDRSGFLGIIAIHIPLGLACVIAGAIAMLSAKGRGCHSIVGRVYYWCLAALFVSATLLAVMRWAENYHLFVFAALAFSSAYFVHRAIQKHWPYWTRMHITGMGLSYTWMLVAFYVDNGPQLPLWNSFHVLAIAACCRAAFDYSRADEPSPAAIRRPNVAVPMVPILLTSFVALLLIVLADEVIE